MKPADCIIRNAPVFTVKAAQPWARAVAVRDGLVAKVGSEEEIRYLEGPDTRVIELDAEHLVLPGFIDSHGHFASGPLLVAGIDLTRADTIEEVCAVLAAADTNGELVRGFGWRRRCEPGVSPTTCWACSSGAGLGVPKREDRADDSTGACNRGIAGNRTGNR